MKRSTNPSMIPEIPNAVILSRLWRGNTADANGEDIPAGIARRISRRDDPSESAPPKYSTANKPGTGKPTPWSRARVWRLSALFLSERHVTLNLPNSKENQPAFCAQLSTVALGASLDICAGRLLMTTAPRIPSIYLLTNGSVQNLFSASHITVMRKAVLSRLLACSVAGFPRATTSDRKSTRLNSSHSSTSYA